MPISSLRISGTALTAERARLDVISENIANAQTTRTPEGGPYRRKEVVFEALLPDEQHPAGGVHVAEVKESDTPMVRVHNPGHPDADARGYVTMPNVNIVEEMVDLITATRAYEANTAAANATKTITARALDLGR